MNKFSRFGRVFLSGFIAMIVGLSLGCLLVADGVHAAGDPTTGTVVGIESYTFYNGLPITQSTTTYTSVPSRMRNYHSADVFLTVDFSGTLTMTVTPQISADGVNWADAWYSYGTSTSTAVYSMVATADGTQYIRMPMIGEYIRFKMVTAGIGTDELITTTIKATMRNNAGR